MKKLSKLKLKEFHEMSDFEMKNVVGGYDDANAYYGNDNDKPNSNPCFKPHHSYAYLRCEPVSCTRPDGKTGTCGIRQAETMCRCL